MNFYCPMGLTLGLNATYVDQEGEFDYNFGSLPIEGSDQFWVMDASLSYRLPKRYGLISLEVKNLWDEEFQFQSMDKASPDYIPEQLVLGKITLAF